MQAENHQLPVYAGYVLLYDADSLVSAIKPILPNLRGPQHSVYSQAIEASRALRAALSAELASGVDASAHLTTPLSSLLAPARTLLGGTGLLLPASVTAPMCATLKYLMSAGASDPVISVLRSQRALCADAAALAPLTELLGTAATLYANKDEGGEIFIHMLLLIAAHSVPLTGATVSAAFAALEPHVRRCVASTLLFAPSADTYPISASVDFPAPPLRALLGAAASFVAAAAREAGGPALAPLVAHASIVDEARQLGLTRTAGVGTEVVAGSGTDSWNAVRAATALSLFAAAATGEKQAIAVCILLIFEPYCVLATSPSDPSPAPLSPAASTNLHRTEQLPAPETPLGTRLDALARFFASSDLVSRLSALTDVSAGLPDVISHTVEALAAAAGRGVTGGVATLNEVLEALVAAPLVPAPLHATRLATEDAAARLCAKPTFEGVSALYHAMGYNDAPETDLALFCVRCSLVSPITVFILSSRDTPEAADFARAVARAVTTDEIAGLASGHTSSACLPAAVESSVVAAASAPGTTTPALLLWLTYSIVIAWTRACAPHGEGQAVDRAVGYFVDAACPLLAPFAAAAGGGAPVDDDALADALSGAAYAFLMLHSDAANPGIKHHLGVAEFAEVLTTLPPAEIWTGPCTCGKPATCACTGHADSDNLWGCMPLSVVDSLFTVIQRRPAIVARAAAGVVATGAWAGAPGLEGAGALTGTGGLLQGGSLAEMAYTQPCALRAADLIYYSRPDSVPPISPLLARPLDTIVRSVLRPLVAANETDPAAASRATRAAAAAAHVTALAVSALGRSDARARPAVADMVSAIVDEVASVAGAVLSVARPAPAIAASPALSPAVRLLVATLDRTIAAEVELSVDTWEKVLVTLLALDMACPGVADHLCHADQPIMQAATVRSDAAFKPGRIAKLRASADNQILATEESFIGESLTRALAGLTDSARVVAQGGANAAQALARIAEKMTEDCIKADADALPAALRNIAFILRLGGSVWRQLPVLATNDENTEKTEQEHPLIATNIPESFTAPYPLNDVSPHFTHLISLPSWPLDSAAPALAAAALTLAQAAPSPAAWSAGWRMAIMALVRAPDMPAHPLRQILATWPAPAVAPAAAEAEARTIVETFGLMLCARRFSSAAQEPLLSSLVALARPAIASQAGLAGRNERIWRYIVEFSSGGTCSPQPVSLPVTTLPAISDLVLALCASADAPAAPAPAAPAADALSAVCATPVTPPPPAAARLGLERLACAVSTVLALAPIPRDTPLPHRLVPVVTVLIRAASHLTPALGRPAAAGLVGVLHLYGIQPFLRRVAPAALAVVPAATAPALASWAGGELPAAVPVLRARAASARTVTEAQAFTTAADRCAAGRCAAPLQIQETAPGNSTSLSSHEGEEQEQEQEQVVSEGESSATQE